jgi:Mg2+-importing ATPase
VAVVLVSLAVPFTPVGTVLGLHALPGIYYAWLAAILAAFSVVMLAGKSIYHRLFGEWL